MRKNEASSGVPSTPFPPHLGQHFLDVAEEARANGNEELAIHFIELALEAFDGAFGQDLDSDADLFDNSGLQAQHLSVAGTPQSCGMG